MSLTIELHSDLPITRPTPVRIPRHHMWASDDAFVLHPETGGAPFAAQTDGDGSLVALVHDLPAGTPVRCHLAPAGDVAAGVRLEQHEDALTLHLPDGPLGTYHYGHGVVRPYLWPLVGPGGQRVTRDYPMADRAGEQQDHPHHRSLWTAYGEVNGVDDWSEEPGHGFIRHRGFARLDEGPVFGGFTSVNLWTGPDDRPLLEEIRTVRVYNAGADERLLDYRVMIYAFYGKLIFGDTKEAGLLSLRVATSMDGARGGRIENADGGVGERACWGQPSAWCDYSGPVTGGVLGVAVLDHPDNPGYPARWHVRDYGLMTTNPLASGAFTGEPPAPVKLRSDDSWDFRYRLLIHRGDAVEGRVAETYQAFASAPRGHVVADADYSDL